MRTKKSSIEDITPAQIQQAIGSERVYTIEQLAAILGRRGKGRSVPRAVARKIQAIFPDIEGVFEQNRIAIVMEERVRAEVARKSDGGNKAGTGVTCPRCLKAELQTLGPKFLACRECGASYPVSAVRPDPVGTPEHPDTQ